MTPADPTTAERVEFAWHRSGLAFAGIGLAIVRRSMPDVPIRPGLVAVLIGIGVALAVAAVVWRTVAHRRPQTRLVQLRAATAGAVAIGVVALITAAVA